MELQDHNAIARVDGRDRLSVYQPRSTVSVSGEVEVWRMHAAWRRRWRLMIVAFLAVVALGVLYILCKRPVYESTAMVTVSNSQATPANSNDLRVLADLQGLTRSASAQSHIQLIRRPDVLAAAAARLPRADIKKGFARTKIPKWAVRVGLADKDSDVIAVTVRAYDPNVAATYANAVVDTYVERDRIYSRMATAQGRRYVRSQLSAVQKQLADAQRELAEHKRKSRIVAPNSQVTAITDSVVALQDSLDKANVELASAQDQMKSLRRQLKAEGKEIQETRTIQVNPRYQTAVAALDALNSNKAFLSQEYSPKSKEMRKLDAEINAAERNLRRVAETVVYATVRSRNPALAGYFASLVNTAAAQARVRAMRSVLKVREARIQELPAFESELTRLTTQVDLLHAIYQDLSQKYYVLLVNENSTLPNARLASPALSLPIPAAPNVPRSLVVSCLLGLLAAIAAAVFAERLDDTVREDTVPDVLAGEYPLAVIPHMDNVGAFIESFRTLRNVINSSRPAGKDSRILVITSPGRGEGKRTVCVNLAVAMAWSGKKTLIVDCDLRESSLANSLNVPGDIGLTSLICGLVSIEEAIQPTGIENVFCLPAGPAPYYPSQFLNSQASLDVLREVSASYDFVIINGPPCVGLSDIQIVSGAADAVVMVVMADQTSRSGLAESLASLVRVNAPYAGYILNRVNDGKRAEDNSWSATYEGNPRESEKPALLHGSPKE